MNPLEQEVMDAIAMNADAAKIKSLFDQAMAAKNWDAVKVICEMKAGPTKPDAAHKDQIIADAKAAGNWGDVTNIINTFKSEDYVPVQGPLNKSEYTTQLEELTREMMSPDGGDFEVKQVNGEDIFVFKNGKEYNWTQIRTNANVQHLEFDKINAQTGENEDFKLYNNYSKSGAQYANQSSLNPGKKQQYINALYREYIAKNKPLPDPLVSMEEMHAINIYTGGFYGTMNALLRGDIKGPDLATNKQRTRAALIHSAMCASGLRKVPETTIKESYRGAKMGTDEEQVQRVIAAAIQGVIPLSGFVSSSINKAAAFGNKPVFLHITNLRGMYVAAISQVPYEQEFLLSSNTQIQLTDYKVVNQRHQFEGRVVNIVSYLTPKELNEFLEVEEVVEKEPQEFMFHVIINSLEGKTAELQNGADPQAYNLSKELLKSLQEYKAAYFDQKTMSQADFANNCQEALDKIPDALDKELKTLNQPSLKAAVALANSFVNNNNLFAAAPVAAAPVAAAPVAAAPVAAAPVAAAPVAAAPVAAAPVAAAPVAAAPVAAAPVAAAPVAAAVAVLATADPAAAAKAFAALATADPVAANTALTAICKANPVAAKAAFNAVQPLALLAAEFNPNPSAVPTLLAKAAPAATAAALAALATADPAAAAAAFQALAIANPGAAAEAFTAISAADPATAVAATSAIASALAAASPAAAAPAAASSMGLFKSPVQAPDDMQDQKNANLIKKGP